MSARIIDDAAQVLANPQAYTDEKRLHEALAHLRAHAPVSWVDVEGYKPFWAITKHADVMDIERQNDLFTNDPRPLLMVSDGEDVLRAQMEAGIGLRTLIHMDDPHHRDNPYFAYLAVAEAVVATADSVSMVSEAASAGKPVYLTAMGSDLKETKFNKRFFALMQKLGYAARWEGKLTLRKQRQPFQNP